MNIWNGPLQDRRDKYIFQCDNCHKITYFPVPTCPYCKHQMYNFQEKQLLLENLESKSKFISIIKENYIHKADYEARLKADMVTILTEIQLEIEEIDSRAGYDGNGMPTFANDYVRIKKVNEIIQQKIDTLKGNENGNE